MTSGDLLTSSDGYGWYTNFAFETFGRTALAQPLRRKVE